MASNAELTAAFQAFIADKVEVSSMTGAQRKALDLAIMPVLNGYRNRKGVNNEDYTAWEVEDELMHIDNVGKTQKLGMVIAVPFDPTSDLNDKAKFDKYQDNKPSI